MCSSETWITHHCNPFLQEGGVSIPLGSFVGFRIDLVCAINTNNSGTTTREQIELCNLFLRNSMTC